MKVFMNAMVDLTAGQCLFLRSKLQNTWGFLKKKVLKGYLYLKEIQRLYMWWLLIIECFCSTIIKLFLFLLSVWGTGIHVYSRLSLKLTNIGWTNFESKFYLITHLSVVMCARNGGHGFQERLQKNYWHCCLHYT